MKAVILNAYGDASELKYEDVPTPEPGSGEVLVKLGATSINPIDWKIRNGSAKQRMPIEFPAILGRDLAGEVVKLGEGVTTFAIGQRVMALTNKTYAEYVVVKADVLALIPDDLGYEQAGALPLVCLTGAQLIEKGMKPKAGQSVLVTGAVGSVGRVSVFVAAQHHAQVIAGVREAQIPEAESLGTLAVVALEDQEGLDTFVDLDAIADTVGGQVADGLLKHLRAGGTFASVVGPPEHAKDFDILVEHVRSEPDAGRLQQLAEAVASKRLLIPIAKVMKLSEAAEAQRQAESGGVRGKIVLIP
jgi:NADPH:quinone reductase-like Zn-dependent oxidoreductase